VGQAHTSAQGLREFRKAAFAASVVKQATSSGYA